ncbi:hypothetical protein BT93_F2938 [Corymbia citriodora subsp. variegata]|nr:hypothetical protein BT93_F2938 [Corymbia citriodora subsp. variegata]KAF8026286.1 hypothetical protein BT93_F2938 [Corymbia citriodora subsp. variegata]KAF8026290.1 hypothetical protein BT93_F2938 [Corymbia citriodora subsp. variegata]
MEASSISSSPVISSTIRQPFGGTRVADRSRPFANRICWRRSGPLNERTTSRRIIAAIDGVSAAVADPGQAEVTWQIVAGAIAGVTPFVVAGIEFSKRIIAQKKCGVCGGSGLVLREKYYFRCPGCGGFLPWQSWKRFFSG